MDGKNVDDCFSQKNEEMQNNGNCSKKSQILMVQQRKKNQTQKLVNLVTSFDEC